MEFRKAIMKGLQLIKQVSKMKKLIQIIIFLVAGFEGYSQDSLIHYLEIAARQNPLVLQKFYEYEAALQKVPQVGALPDPQANAGIFLSPMEIVTGKKIAEFQLMQMFPWFGTLSAAKDEMSLMAKAKYETFRDTKLQLFYDIQRTWYELNKIRHNIRITDKNINILKTLERMALVRFKTAPVGGDGANSSGINMPGGFSTPGVSSSGTSGGMEGMAGNNRNTPAGNSSNQNRSGSSMQNNQMAAESSGSALSDLYRIQIEIIDLENNIALLNNVDRTITARFNNYLNRREDTMISVPDTLRQDSLDFSYALIYDSIPERNPMLGMLDYEQQSIEARKKMVTRMGYPMLGLGLNYMLNNKDEMLSSEMNGKDMIMPMVSVTIPVYRKKYRAMRNETDLLKEANRQNYNVTSNSLKNEYYEALQLYEDAKRRVHLYENQGELANQSLNILTRSFSTSGSGLTDILQIRRLIYDYEYRKIEAVSDFNTAIAWLKRIGSID
jgi:outer membrane protein TolC